MKKILKIIGISLLILILLRGFLFRLVINYAVIGARAEIEIKNKNLIDRIEDRLGEKEIHMKSIAKIATEITREELGFTTSKASSDPNELMKTKQTNCVGYSTMFNSIANFLIRKSKLQNEIKATHQIAQLELLGVNLHQYFDSPFFRDHDFNTLLNRNTGEEISIDPSVSDYLRINRISVTKLKEE